MAGPVVRGKPLVWYMGCDSRNEYIYKYVSNAVWDPADATRGLVAGDKYMDDGRLYVARFNADGSDHWIELKWAIPGKVGDGGKKTITSADGSNTRAVDTFVGA
jgi:secreted PhoX family phosphatase